MNEILELQNLPWQTLQRRLAEAFGSQTAGYPAARQTQPHWRFAPSDRSWLSRTPSGVVMRPQSAAWATL